MTVIWRGGYFGCGERPFTCRPAYWYAYCRKSHASALGSTKNVQSSFLREGSQSGEARDSVRQDRADLSQVLAQTSRDIRLSVYCHVLHAFTLRRVKDFGNSLDGIATREGRRFQSGRAAK